MQQSTGSLDSIGAALEWLRFAVVVLLGIVGYFLKRSLDTQSDLEQEVKQLRAEVGALRGRISAMLDRDRMRRLADYLNEDKIEHDRERDRERDRDRDDE